MPHHQHTQSNNIYQPKAVNKMYSKFNKLHPENKEEFLNVLILAIFILCLVFLKPLVRILLTYVDFCNRLFN